MRRSSVHKSLSSLLVLLAATACTNHATGAAGPAPSPTCSYVGRAQNNVLKLTERGGTVGVRIGEDVLLHAEGPLTDVTVDGPAGLAPGTQNGVAPKRDYVFSVTGLGKARVSAKVSGRRVTGTVTSTC